MKQSLKKIDGYKIPFDTRCVSNITTKIYKFPTIEHEGKIMVVVMMVKDADCLGLYSDFEISTNDVKRIVNVFFNPNDFIIIVESFNIDEIDLKFLYSEDDKLFVYFKIQPISLELLSPRERKPNGKDFSSEFSSIKRVSFFCTVPTCVLLATL